MSNETDPPWVDALKRTCGTKRDEERVQVRVGDLLAALARAADADELEAGDDALEQARQEGYDEGHKDGYEQAKYDAGR